MIFFHNSNEKLTRIIPHIGGSRHGGEDPRAVGKAVVWLSNKPQTDIPPMKYQYEVEISPDDPDLLMDEPFGKLQEDFGKLFNVTNDWRWYFCLKEVEVVTTSEWDPNTSSYVKL